jgi:hypothetical protein
MALAADSSGTCALLATGALRCWGEGDVGELGNGTVADSLVPVAVSIAGVTAVTHGGQGACAIANGQLSCWGANGITANGDDSDLRALPITLTCAR